jgi:hypothetical protein
MRDNCVLDNINVKLNLENELSNFENRIYDKRLNYINNLMDIEGNTVFRIFN